MPLDKFGRHLHQHYPVDQSNQVYLVEDATNLIEKLKHDVVTIVNTDVSSYTYSTMFYVMAIQTDSKGRYQLINANTKGEYVYKLPTAIITDMTCNPPDSKIYINNVEKNKDALLGSTLQEGDKIRVTYKANSKHILACEFVIQISIRKTSKSN